MAISRFTNGIKHIYQATGTNTTNKIVLVRQGNDVVYPATQSLGTGSFSWPHSAQTNSAIVLNISSTLQVASHELRVPRADGTTPYFNVNPGIGSWVSVDIYRCVRILPQTVERGFVIKSSFDLKSPNPSALLYVLLVRRKLSDLSLIDGGGHLVTFKYTATNLVPNDWRPVWMEVENAGIIASTNIVHDLIPLAIHSSLNNQGPSEIRGIACAVNIY